MIQGGADLAKQLRNQTPVNNVEYQKCGPRYYRVAFQRPNLIYVAQQLMDVYRELQRASY